MSHPITGWCSTGYHDDCPYEIWLSAQQVTRQCGCTCHQEAPAAPRRAEQAPPPVPLSPADLRALEGSQARVGRVAFTVTEAVSLADGTVMLYGAKRPKAVTPDWVRANLLESA